MASRLPEVQSITPDVDPKERVEIMEKYVEEASRDPLVRRMADQIAADNPQNVPQAIVDAQHKFVRYELDCGDGTCEILQTARRTILTGRGDCKKKSILVAGMLRYLGYPAQVVWLHQQDNGAPNNHVAAQICLPGLPRADAPTVVKVYSPSSGVSTCGEGWQWVETTLPGAIIGRDPYQELARLGADVGRVNL